MSIQKKTENSGKKITKRGFTTPKGPSTKSFKSVAGSSLSSGGRFTEASGAQNYLQVRRTDKIPFKNKIHGERDFPDRVNVMSDGGGVIRWIEADSVEGNVNLGAAIKHGMSKLIIEEQADLINQMIVGGVLPRSTLDDAKKSKKDTLSPANSERIIRAMRMRKQVVDALGENRADTWLEKPNKNFGDQSAIELAKTEAGARAVEQFLLRLSHGFNA